LRAVTVDAAFDRTRAGKLPGSNWRFGRETPVAERGLDDELAELGYLRGVLTKRPGQPPAAEGRDPLRLGSGATAGGDVAFPGEEGSRRRALLGRLAAVFYLGSGLLGLVTLPLPAPGSNRAATISISVAALVAGTAILVAPWGRWPRRAGLLIVPPAFALIALANTFGGSDLHAYGVFFVVAFVWIGLAQPPRTSLLMAPLAAAAYTLPMFSLPGDIGAGAASAATTIGVCVLVGEGIAWGMVRLERIELALHLERYRSEQLRELDGMKDAFLSAVSHELRTPLTVCRGHLDVMADDAGEQEARAVREILVSELDLMGRLVEDLTTLARVGDRVLLKAEPMPLDHFVGSIAAMAEPILGDRLLVDYESTAATIRADSQRLTQALLNLLQNAAGHAQRAGPVRLRVLEEPASWRFEVADNGGGLPAGEEQLVFEPFRTASPQTGRTGLGLSIVRGIARAHDGESGVVNRPGRGATFWIRIPR
jgi:signal transduction histidine kinase